ncbi:MAG: hypothetical protein FJ125_15405 [Deltaproteobacteria bacterium]|nr:hypothetical protein [Deltaproteobacteria bacterium]
MTTSNKKQMYFGVLCDRLAAAGLNTVGDPGLEAAQEREAAEAGGQLAQALIVLSDAPAIGGVDADPMQADLGELGECA